MIPISHCAHHGTHPSLCTQDTHPSPCMHDPQPSHVEIHGSLCDPDPPRHVWVWPLVLCRVSSQMSPQLCLSQDRLANSQSLGKAYLLPGALSQDGGLLPTGEVSFDEIRNRSVEEQWQPEDEPPA